MTLRAGRSRRLLGALVLLLAVLPYQAVAQEPATGDKPTVPGQPPGPTPIPEPIPVIPEPLPLPPSTVPSTPQRLLPVPSAGLPPTAIFQLEPSLTLSEEYTDNFNLTKRDKQSNFRSAVSPALRLLINSAFTKGVVAYTFAPSHDSATDDLQLFHTLLGQVTWEATPLWKLTVADTLTRGDQPAEADRLGLRLERQTFTSNTFSLASDYLLARVATRQSYVLSTFSDDGGGKTTSHALAASASVPIYATNSLSLGYDYIASKTSNGSDLGGGSQSIVSTGGDTSGHQFTGAFSRQLTTVRSVGVKGSYALRTLTDDTGDTDYRLWNVSVFTTYALLGRLTINGSLGVSGLTLESGESLGPNLFSSTSITYQFGPALASVAMDQGFSETFTGGQNFGVVETSGITGSLTYPFTPSLSGTASATYRRSKATGIGNIETGTGGDQQSESYGGTLAFSWRILPKVLLDLTYSYLKQVGSDNNRQVGTTSSQQVGTDNGYTENRVKASINVSF